MLVGGPKANPWTGPLGHVAGVRLASLRASQKVVFFVAKFTREDFLVLRELLEAWSSRSEATDRRLRPVLAAGPG